VVAIHGLLAADPSVPAGTPWRFRIGDGRRWTFLGWGEVARFEGALDTVRESRPLFAG
jgi:hypothetical protein